MDRYTVITREMAQDLLDLGGPQRPLKRHLVAAYRYDMEHGDWNHGMSAPITRSPEPPHYLTNGQHRMVALAGAAEGTTIKAEILNATFEEVRDPNRYVSDVLTAGGDLGKPLSAAYATGNVWAGTAERARSMSVVRQAEWVRSRATLIAHQEDIKAAEVRTKSKALVPRIPIGTVGALYDVAGMPSGAGVDAVSDFIDEITHVPQMDKVLQVLLAVDIRRRGDARSIRLSHKDYALVVVRAFAAWVNDEELRSLYARRSSLLRVPGFVEWRADWNRIGRERAVV